MGRYKFYILPHIVEELVQKDLFDDFGNNLERTFRFITDYNKFWQIQLYGDVTNFETLADLGLYSAKSILSFFVDTNGLFFRFKNEAKSYAYSYFIIENRKIPPFVETTENSIIELFENSVVSNIPMKILCYEPIDPLSILRVKTSLPYELPKLHNIDAVTVERLKQEVLFETHIKPEFGKDYAKYIEFKDSYLKFYAAFDWENWNPRINPFPAHSTLDLLKAVHTLNKEDEYLLKWGLIMASLNGGKFNKQLTQLNQKKNTVNYIFQCYSESTTNTVFYSVDTENGTLEMYDHKGQHLGKIYGIQISVRAQSRQYTIEVPEAKWLDANCL